MYIKRNKKKKKENMIKIKTSNDRLNESFNSIQVLVYKLEHNIKLDRFSYISAHIKINVKLVLMYKREREREKASKIQ